MNAHDHYGLAKVINARGPYPPLGVSRSPKRVSRAIADFSGSEAGVVTHCVASGMTLSIAATMTGTRLTESPLSQTQQGCPTASFSQQTMRSSAANGSRRPFTSPAPRPFLQAPSTNARSRTSIGSSIILISVAGSVIRFQSTAIIWSEWQAPDVVAWRSQAACSFVGRIGGLAGIGRLDDALAILEGKAGTVVH